jgi:hypothetical protein
MLREIYFLSIFEAMDDRLHERQLFALTCHNPPANVELYFWGTCRSRDWL